MTIYVLRSTKKHDRLTTTTVNQELAEGRINGETLAWRHGIPFRWHRLRSRWFHQLDFQFSEPASEKPREVLSPPINRRLPKTLRNERTSGGSSFLLTDRDGRLTHDYGSLVDSVPQLPTLPSVIMELTSLLQDPHQIHADRISGIVKQDQSITTHVLRVANLTYYAGCGKAGTVNGAIQLLGFDKIKRIALTSTFLSKLGISTVEAFDWKEFWKHSIAVGIAASTLAKILQKEDQEVFFTAGLLHDLGKVVSFLVAPDAMAKVVAFAQEKKISMLAAERACGAPEHDRLGAKLCQRWQLPEVITSVIANHHLDNRNRRALNLDCQHHLHVDVVSLANCFVHGLDFGFSGHRLKEAPSPELLRRLGWSMEDVPGLGERINRELDLGSGLLDIL